MGKLALYFRLATQSQRKNRQFYAPFLLTAAGCAAMFYILRFITDSEMPQSMKGGAYVYVVMQLGCIVIAYTAMCILWYANRFVMRRRTRELGLYHILGMRKGDIALVLVLESLLLGAGSIVLGLAAGILFSKLALMLLFRLLRFSVPLGFYISRTGLWQTAVLMALIFIVLLVSNLISVWRSRPVELLHSENVGEREPKSRVMLAIVGGGTLAMGYAIAILVKQPVTALMLFFVAVTLVIIGTHCLFAAGSIVLLKALRKNKAFYYKPRNFTAVSGMLYRMKQNAKGLANICVLTTMVLVTVSCTVCMYAGAEDSLHALYPNEISLHFICDPALYEQADYTPVGDAAKKAADKVPGSSFAAHTRLTFMTSPQEGGYALSAPQSKLSALDEISVDALLFMTAEDYNRLTGAHITLEQDEVLAPVGEAASFWVGDMTFRTAGNYETYPVNSDAFNYAKTKTRGYVVADKTVMLALYNRQLAAYGNAASSLVYNITAQPEGTKEENIALLNEMLDASTQVTAQQGDAMGITALGSQYCRSDQRDEVYETYGSFLFLGLFLGLLFLLATVLIIYYKQLSEGYEDRQRFVIMQQVGMGADEVRETIRRQVLLIFFLPLALAAVHVIMAFPMITRLFTLFSLYNVPLFALCSVGTFLVFALGYVLVYAATARQYYRIVRA